VNGPLFEGEYMEVKALTKMIDRVQDGPNGEPELFERCLNAVLKLFLTL